MLRWFRLHASRLAAILLVSVGALDGALLSPHADDCHDACVPSVVEHDASAHRWQGSTPDEDAHPLHCLVCHWARSFRPNTETRIVSALAAPAGVPIHVAPFTVAHSSPAAQPPLRSPPLSPEAV